MYFYKNTKFLLFRVDFEGEKGFYNSIIAKNTSYFKKQFLECNKMEIKKHRKIVYMKKKVNIYSSIGEKYSKNIINYIQKYNLSCFLR